MIFTFAVSGALAGLAGIIEVAGPIGHLQPGISPGYGFTAIIVAFLGRLNPVGILIAGLFLALTFIGGEGAQISLKVPLDLTKVFQGILLFYVLACDSLIVYRIRFIATLRSRRERRRMGLLEAIILSVIAASTPLLLAAAGELVVERSGVLNLGVEGMMIMGAACGFAGAYLTGSTFVGALFGIVAGAALSVVFALLTLGLAVNQVATGLALTILGIGLSGLIGAGFVGQKDRARAASAYPGAHRHSVRRPHPVRRRTRFVYFSIALVIGDLVVPLPHPWRPHSARGRRQPHLGACARLSGAEDPAARGAVRRRLRRARRRLSAARLHAVLHSRHDRRPRLDRAGAGGVLRRGGRRGWSAAPICSARSPSCNCTRRRSASAFHRS